MTAPRKPERIRTFDLSPDGRRLLVAANGSGWLLPLDGAPATAIELDGTVLDGT